MKKINSIHHLLKALREMRLSAVERDRLRERLIAYADLHAVPARIAVPRTVWGGIAWMMPGAPTRALAVVLVIAFAGGGVAYAAKDAKPGEDLYPARIALTEPVAGMLIPDSVGKAEWYAILAEQRLSEAAALAAEDQLSPEVRAFITKEFLRHADRSGEYAKRAAALGRARESLALRTDLEARIAAHQDILSLLAGQGVESQSDTEAGVLLAAVRSEVEQLGKTRSKAEAILLARTLGPSSSELELIARATDTLETAILETTNSQLAKDAAHLRVTTARDALAQAAALAGTDPARAYEKARDAKRLAQEAATILKNQAVLAVMPLPAQAAESVRHPDLIVAPSQSSEVKKQEDLRDELTDIEESAKRIQATLPQDVDAKEASSLDSEPEAEPGSSAAPSSNTESRNDSSPSSSEVSDTVKKTINSTIPSL